MYSLHIKFSSLFLALALFLLGISAPIPAQTPPAPSPKAAAVIQAPVKINGETLFSVGGPDPQTRAQRITSRIQTLITRKSEVDNFTVEKQEGSYLILVGDIPVLTVTSTDAQDALMQPEALAREWGGILTEAVKRARSERGSWVQRILNPVRRSFNQLVDDFLAALPRIISALLLFFLTIFFARIVRAGVMPVMRRVNLDDNLRLLIGSLAYYGSWVIGMMVIASVLGFQASSLVAALGVSGFVLGFAFKDILSHFLAGILLLAGRSFQIGDQITVKEYEGTVERIDLRATHLRTYDNRLVIIPNADVFTSAVTNNTQSQLRRQEFDVGIDYADGIANAQLIAFKAMRETSGVLPDPSPDVLVADLAASWVTLRCRFWTDSRRANFLAVGSEVRRRVKEALDREGVYLPFQITELRFGPSMEAPVLHALTTLDGNSGEAGGDGTRLSLNGTTGLNRQSEQTPPSEEESKAKAEAALPQHPSTEAG